MAKERSEPSDQLELPDLPDPSDEEWAGFGEEEDAEDKDEEKPEGEEEAEGEGEGEKEEAEGEKEEEPDEDEARIKEIEEKVEKIRKSAGDEAADEYLALLEEKADREAAEEAEKEKAKEDKAYDEEEVSQNSTVQFRSVGRKVESLTEQVEGAINNAYTQATQIYQTIDMKRRELADEGVSPEKIQRILAPDFQQYEQLYNQYQQAVQGRQQVAQYKRELKALQDELDDDPLFKKYPNEYAFLRTGGPSGKPLFSGETPVAVRRRMLTEALERAYGKPSAQAKSKTTRLTPTQREKLKKLQSVKMKSKGGGQRRSKQQSKSKIPANSPWGKEEW